MNGKLQINIVFNLYFTLMNYHLENNQNCLLCTMICTHTHEQFLDLHVGLGLDFVLRVCFGLTLCIFLCKLRSVQVCVASFCCVGFSAELRLKKARGNIWPRPQARRKASPLSDRKRITSLVRSSTEYQ